MIDWNIRLVIDRAIKIVESGAGKDGTIVRRGSVIEYYSRGNRKLHDAKICCVWNEGDDIVQAKIKYNNQYSTGCLSSCPERREGTCTGSTAWYARFCLAIYQGCEKCMSCVSTCKSEEPCSLHEGVIKE